MAGMVGNGNEVAGMGGALHTSPHNNEHTVTGGKNAVCPAGWQNQQHTNRSRQVAGGRQVGVVVLQVIAGGKVWE